MELEVCIGKILFDKDGKIQNIKKEKDRERYINEYKIKENEISFLNIGEEVLYRVMQGLKELNLDYEYRKINLKITEHLLKESANIEHIAIHLSSLLEEKERWLNNVSKRLREMTRPWFFREEHIIEAHREFAEMIKIAKLDIDNEEKKIIDDLASDIIKGFEDKEKLETYLENIMNKIAKNLTALCTPTIAARLLREAGSLKKLALMPSSTIQILGAEKALFRHLRNKKTHLPPKHGCIFTHPLLQRASKDKKGKIARVLADRISIAAKLDFFKGEFRGDVLYKEIEEIL